MPEGTGTYLGLALDSLVFIDECNPSKINIQDEYSRWRQIHLKSQMFHCN